MQTVHQTESHEVRQVVRDTTKEEQKVNVKDSIRIKDSTVLVVDTIGKVLREYRYIHEYHGRDTVEKIVYVSAARDSSLMRDTLADERHYEVKEKKKTVTAWPWWMWMVPIALAAGVYLNIRRKHG